MSEMRISQRGGTFIVQGGFLIGRLLYNMRNNLWYLYNKLDMLNAILLRMNKQWSTLHVHWTTRPHYKVAAH